MGLSSAHEEDGGLVVLFACISKSSCKALLLQEPIDEALCDCSSEMEQWAYSKAEKYQLPDLPVHKGLGHKM